MDPKSIFSEEESSKLKKLFGKEDKDLYSHLIDVGKNSEYIVNRIYISEEITRSIDERLIKEMIILQSYLHDLGKADKKFQHDKKQNPNQRSESPHPLFSLPLANEIIKRKLNEKSNINEKIKKVLLNISILSIATHHSDYSNELYSRFRSEIPEYDGLTMSIKTLPYDLLQDAYEYITNLPEKKKWRYLYSIFNGVLRMSDWFASGNISIENGFLKSPNEIQEFILNYISKNNWSIKSYQEYVRNHDFTCGYLFLPTGDGKTETALLTPVEHINKIIYTLPTVTTVESMRHRFENYFGKENISYSHHLLFLSLYEEGELDRRILHEYNLNKIIITTIDRILLSLMNWKHYPLLELSLNNSYLIVDEIHSYTPRTLSLILNALEYIKKFHNAKILVMSATLPDLIKEQLKSRINALPILPENKMEEGYSRKKRVNVIFKSNDYLIKKDGLEEYSSNYIDEIKNLVMKNRKKVLVVLNTVDKAKAFYKLIKEALSENNINVYLIHSRFTQEDKKNKMDLIEKIKKDVNPCILISTQVVEVSLDIDFDVLYTEIAPFDSLIQRFGRINRAGRKQSCAVYVFRTENSLPYDDLQIKITSEMLNNTLDTEIEFLKTNNSYYEKMRNNYEKEFQINPLEDFLGNINRNDFGESMITRDSSFITVPVIIAGSNLKYYYKIKKILENWDQYNDKEKVNIKAEILKKVIELPLYSVNKIKIEDSKLKELFGLIFVKASYSPEIGVIPNERGAVIL
ncbi:MAG: CRISPR-associated helicase Cas3' [Candidatus Nanopusillus acidilobi]